MVNSQEEGRMEGKDEGRKERRKHKGETEEDGVRWGRQIDWRFSDIF